MAQNKAKKGTTKEDWDALIEAMRLSAGMQAIQSQTLDPAGLVNALMPYPPGGLLGDPGYAQQNMGKGIKLPPKQYANAITITKSQLTLMSKEEVEHYMQATVRQIAEDIIDAMLKDPDCALKPEVEEVDFGRAIQISLKLEY